MLPRVLPFAVFMGFIALEEGLRTDVVKPWLSLPDTALNTLYPLKAGATALLLLFFWNRYRELRLRDLNDLKATTLSLCVGAATFLLWIKLPVTLPMVGAPAGFDPALFSEGGPRLLMTAARVAGAVLVVPVMEELFWRSFLLRYLIQADFESVPIGRFNWGAFTATTVLFALEHHFFLAGLAAGAAYNILLYRTRSIAHCVLAHAVTNMALACYVLGTGRWYFW
ncbi:CAAX prenyl protease-related protein [Geomonas oryzisoli]|uniref:CAAX prenyl protease-related protein n=1 Tax=Geomonas oryzisoli TaxID=2847992 RepID=A0ABX8J4A2_9BACT|nr:CAAX prenyl protease-related protein [Geomonas oryzisoli]QWV91861.1 CAAX prenyl protease-related protein [Geomonas oryzisoli]